MPLGTLGPIISVSLEEAEAAALPHWKQLARVPEEELGRLDLAFVQMVTNMGLPGSERLNPHGCMRSLWAMADRVGTYTNQHLPRFHRDPSSFENSEAYFRALCMATVLQKEFGVKYDMAKVPRDVPFEGEDQTVQGIIYGNGGTCASLPVLYASVGRKLGYPIKLATVFVDQEVLHLIARWDGGGARFNIETTGTGLATPPDEHYRRGKYQGTPELERYGRFLQSKTPRMELAGFLQERARYCQRIGNRLYAADAWAWSYVLDTTNAVSHTYLRNFLHEWTRSIEERVPPDFPMLTVGHPCGSRFFPESLPWIYEHQILELMSAERLLHDSRVVQVWEKMRRGEWKGRGSNRVRFDYHPDGSSEVTLELNP